ncbi:MAG: STAS domain-containing protein [Candidatus Eremiobacterota bacterium]
MEGTGARIKISELNPSVMVIQLSGKIDTTTSDKISQEVVEVIEQMQTGILFNLKDVTFVSSAGIRMFLTACKKAGTMGLKSAMCYVNPSIYKIFKVAGLEKSFNIFDDESQALNTVWPPGNTEKLT